MKDIAEQFTELSEIEQNEIILPGTILLGARGSHSHGMFVPSDDPDSIDDVDLMGVFVAKPEFYLGFAADAPSRKSESADGFIKRVLNPDYAGIWVRQFDTVHYEIRKFVKLLLNANPNVITFLWIDSDDHLLFTPEGMTLVANRRMFVSKKVYQTFSGYAKGQLQQMEKLTAEVLFEIDHRREHLSHYGVTFETKSGAPVMPAGLQPEAVALVGEYEKLRKKYFGGFMGDKRRQLVKRVGYDSKNAAHLIRLLKMGAEFLETGEFKVKRLEDREELLDIKKGKWPIEQVKQLSSNLFEQAAVAYEKSELPEEADREGAELVVMDIISRNLSSRLSEYA